MQSQYFAIAYFLMHFGGSAKYMVLICHCVTACDGARDCNLALCLMDAVKFDVGFSMAFRFAYSIGAYL